jgi:nucleolar GTP-binding protein
MKVYNSDILLEKAFHTASKCAENIPATKKLLRGKESTRISTFSDILINKLKEYIRQFYGLKEDKYMYLRRIYIKDNEFKECLEKLKELRKTLIELKKKYRSKLEKCVTTNQMRKVRQEHFGRCARIFKKYKKYLDEMNDLIITMKKYPDFKRMKTFILAGLPNVGKSSLLSKLTKSKPEIKSYPFTTKSLLTGYIDEHAQIIDTPGLLDREDFKRNLIEKNAIVALDILGDYIIYFFDAAEIGGEYEKQMNLYSEIKERFKDKEIIKVVNKIDLNRDHKFKDICDFEVSCETGEGIEELKKKIIELSK